MDRSSPSSRARARTRARTPSSVKGGNPSSPSTPACGPPPAGALAPPRILLPSPSSSSSSSFVLLEWRQAEEIRPDSSVSPSSLGDMAPICSPSSPSLLAIEHESLFLPGMDAPARPVCSIRLIFSRPSGSVRVRACYPKPE